MTAPRRIAIALASLSAFIGFQWWNLRREQQQVWIIRAPTWTMRVDHFRRQANHADGTAFWSFRNLATGKFDSVACFDSRFGEDPMRPKLNPQEYWVRRETE